MKRKQFTPNPNKFMSNRTSTFELHDRDRTQIVELWREPLIRARFLEPRVWPVFDSPTNPGSQETLRLSQCESESITPGRPAARSHRDWRSAGRRSGVVSAYILNKNPSASPHSVKTASPCGGAFHEKYSATYVLKSSISSIVSMEPRKDWSGLNSRGCIPGSFYSLQSTVGGCRIPVCRPSRLFTIASEA